MKNIFKFIILIIDSAYALVITFIKYIKDLFFGRIGEIQDNKRNNEIIIMGNGPSLKQINFQLINRNAYRFCCVNYYPVKNEFFFILKPEYLCLIDPAFYDFTIKAEEENFKTLLQNLERVDWKLKIIAPNGKKINVSNPNVSYAWINTNTITYDICCIEKWFLYNKNLANSGMQNVVLAAMYYFLMTNFKKIFICGVDFSDFKSLYVDENNRIYVDSTHSYGTTRYYFDEIPEYGFSELYKLLGAYQKMFLEASKVKQYANYKKIEIINLSQQSYIDSFRKEHPSVLENFP